MPGCFGLSSYEKDYRITMKTDGETGEELARVLLAVVKKKTNYRIMRIKEKDRLWRKGVFFFSVLCLYFQKYEQRHGDINKPLQLFVSLMSYSPGRLQST